MICTDNALDIVMALDARSKTVVSLHGDDDVRNRVL